MRIVFVAFLMCLSNVAVGQNQQADTNRQRLDRRFQAATAEYDAGRFADAVAHLENLLREVPENFEAHELLGLAYSAEALEAKANPHLEKAVRLKPNSAAAHTNLAANLARLNKYDLAEVQFKKAAELDPFNAALRKRLIVQLIQAKDYGNAKSQMEDYVQRFPADTFMRQLLARVQSMGQPK